MKQKRPTKIENVIQLANECIAAGRYLPTFHAECRQFERDITLSDALYVIKHGYRELKHDQYQEEWLAWNYAISGNTLQDEKIRVIVSFEDKKKLLIITVINISKHG